MDNRTIADRSDCVSLEEAINATLVRLQNKKIKECIEGDADQIRMSHELFYNQVVFSLYQLGNLTENKGHCKDFDRLKDIAFKLIGL